MNVIVNVKRQVSLPWLSNWSNELETLILPDLGLLVRGHAVYDA